MYGIIGYPLLQTFSPGYFNKKFEEQGIHDTYEKFPLNKIDGLKQVLERHPNLKGMNVTIPYKQAVIALLDELDDTAQQIGAVNTISIKNGRLKGYNTDTIGFTNSLKPLLKPRHNKALILGTGGASKAVAYALKKLNISYQFVSRNKIEGQLSYTDLNKTIIEDHKLIINTTPLGMVPHENALPDIPYAFLSAEHLLYDLIYHPEETLFLKKGKEYGATIKNGYEMLIGQAEAAWEIWQQD
jgi:shikimate dehydrogenase